MSPRVLPNGTHQWYPGNLNPICTLVMQTGSLSPSVLPNGTQAILNPICTLVMQKGCCHPGYSPMVPRQSQSYMYISNADRVIVTQCTPQWYPGNLNPICTLVMQKGHCHSTMVPRHSQYYMYISNAEGGRCHPGYSPMVPRQSQSYMYMYISNADRVIVTQCTPQWYPGNLNPICTLVMQKGSLSPRVLPNGTQAISILYVH